MTVSLIPDIPEEERKHFNKFYGTYSKLLALDNLEYGEIDFHKHNLKRIIELLKKGLYDDARQEMSDTLIKLQMKMEK